MDVYLHFLIGGDRDSGIGVLDASTLADDLRTRHFAVSICTGRIKAVSAWIKRYLSSTPLVFGRLVLL
jgi:hypothetical protein